MSDNQATYDAIFEATNRIEVVRACLGSDRDSLTDKITENDGMSSILYDVIDSLAKHVEMLMDEETERRVQLK